MSHSTTLPLAAAILSALIAPAFAQQDPAELWNSENAIEADPAKIEIRDQVRIAAEVPGRIILLDPAHVGDTVKAGQVVVKLDDSVQQAELLELELKAEDVAAIEAAEDEKEIAGIELEDKKERNRQVPNAFTKTEIRRLELDFKRAGSKLKKALHDRKVALQAVETKKVQLQQYTVTTSMGGKVESLNFHSIGSSVRQGDPIMEIVNLDKVTAILTVDQTEYDNVQVGDTVLLRQDTSPVGGNDDGGASSGGLFSAAPGESRTRLSAIRPAVPADTITFVGKVTHFANDAKNDNENSLQVVAVVDNQMSGPEKHILRQGVRVKAKIIPSK